MMCAAAAFDLRLGNHVRSSWPNDDKHCHLDKKKIEIKYVPKVLTWCIISAMDMCVSYLSISCLNYNNYSPKFRAALSRSPN